MKGYYDSEVICRPSETGDRLIHFDLIAKPVEETETPVTLELNEEKTLAIKQKYSETAQASSVLLAESIKETTPAEQGPAVQYVERYLEDNGYKCYVEIFKSRKHQGKFAILINRYSSEVKFNKDKFTEAAIIAVAILAEHVRWNPSDLFFDYYAIFEVKNESVGWAIISVEDCVAARKLFLSTSNIDKFTSFWKSKIQYISDTDPKPIL
jgi:ribosomal protein L4